MSDWLITNTYKPAQKLKSKRPITITGKLITSFNPQAIMPMMLNSIIAFLRPNLGATVPPSKHPKVIPIIPEIVSTVILLRMLL